MRIVDQQQIVDAKQRRDKKARRLKRRKNIGLMLAVSIFIGVGVYIYHRPKHVSAPADKTITQTETTHKVPKIAQFTAEQFRNLYNSFSYPNTEQIEVPPDITGNVTADARLRTLAEARGYKLRSVALNGLLPINTSFSIQPLALQPWLDMQSAAAKDGLNLDVAAAYRSIDDQRELFQQKMNEQGITADDIANGGVDETVNLILERTAIPGYSRHHTGFTLDLICDEVDLFNFDKSPCYDWLSADNYAHAKQFGWVPSYPLGTTDQGPEPEPWEYIWVGRDALYTND